MQHKLQGATQCFARCVILSYFIELRLSTFLRISVTLRSQTYNLRFTKKLKEKVFLKTLQIISASNKITKKRVIYIFIKLIIHNLIAIFKWHVKATSCICG